MRRLSKLKAVHAPAAASSELERRRADPERSPPLPGSHHASSTETNRPVWHKDNYGFWLLACVMISVIFSVVYRAFA